MQNKPPTLAELRENYTMGGLDITDIADSPFDQFNDWMTHAVEGEIIDANAMTLATADENGIPSARIVLLKHFDDEGFCFFTNYDSHKGQNLLANPNAALVLHWKELERQICIRGSVTKTTKEESETYFHQRPHGSQIGAIVSEQSREIPNREHLIGCEQDLLREFPEGTTVPLPEFWGGFRLAPLYIEFWQGRPSRLHDRIVYRRDTTDSDWVIRRLAP